MTDTAEALPAGTQVLDYAIERLVGAPGHFGLTYVARRADGLRVALKEFFPRELALRAGERLRLRRPEDAGLYKWGLRGFLDEAALLTRFEHPNIVRGLQAFEHNDTAYLAMELIEGESLGAVLAREGRMAEVRLRPFLMPIVDGIAAAHAAGLLHRDICPDDILVAADGRPVLVDFAAARNVLRFKSRKATLAFTPGYAPIEEYQVSGRQGAWTDVYSLGAVAYRAVSGVVPPEAPQRVQGASLVPALEAGRGRYPEPFLAAIDWALRIAPAQRPQSVGDWQQALEGEEPVPAEAGDATAETAASPASATPAEPVAPSAAPTVPPRPRPSRTPVEALPEAPRSAPSPPSLSAAPRRILIAGAVGALLLGGGVAAMLLRTPSAGAPAADAAVAVIPASDTGAAPQAELAAIEPVARTTAAGADEVELSRLDRMALQLLQQDQEARERAAAEQAQAEAAARGREAEARERAAREQAEVERRLAEEQDAQRRRALEEEQARLRAEDEARQKAEQERAARAAATEVASLEPAGVTIKTPDQCNLHVSQLTRDGSMTYERARLIEGARVDESGIIRLPPVQSDDGRRVKLEILPDHCVRVTRATR